AIRFYFKSFCAHRIHFTNYFIILLVCIVIQQHPEVTFYSVFIFAFAELEQTLKLIIILLNERLGHAGELDLSHKIRKFYHCGLKLPSSMSLKANSELQP